MSDSDMRDIARGCLLAGALALLAMAIAFCTPVHAGTCPWIPSFPAEFQPVPPGGPDGAAPATCNQAEQKVECRCSECFTWDAVPWALRYQVRRRSPSGTYWTVTVKGRPYENEDGTTVVYPPPTIYCPAKHDEDMPVEGTTYAYQVAWCDAQKCSPWTYDLAYTAAPYAVDTFRPPVKGN